MTKCTSTEVEGWATAIANTAIPSSAKNVLWTRVAVYRRAVKTIWGQVNQALIILN